MSASQRVSRGFHRLGILVSIFMVPTTGASTLSLADTRSQDRAACELKALELYATKGWEEERAYYVTVCRDAAGYARKYDAYGSSDNTRHRHHAACKLKALELYKSRVQGSEFEDEQVHYLQICMEAQGYKVRKAPDDACKTPTSWVLDDCFQ